MQLLVRCREPTDATMPGAAELFAMRDWVVSGILNTTAASELVQQGLQRVIAFYCLYCVDQIRALPH